MTIKVALLINSKSQTSVPMLWANSLNKSSSNQSHIRLFSFLEGMKQINKLFDYDIIQCHHQKSAIIMYFLSIVLRKRNRFVFVSQGSYYFLSKVNKVIQSMIYKFFDHIVFVNFELFNQLEEYQKQILKEKHSVVFNAIERLEPSKDDEIFEKYSINPSKKLIFNPARTVIEKNQITLLESIRILSKKYKDILLVIAGNGDQMKNIVTYIQTHQLEKNVILLGSIPRSDVLRLYNKCAVYCMVSISEGLNTTFLEAIQLKVNIVVSDIAQFTYPLKKKGLNAGELNICLTDPNSATDIAICIEKILLTDKKSTLKKFPFLLEDMWAEYQNIYERIL